MNGKIRLPSTRCHKILNLLSLMLLVGIFAYLLLNWRHIPSRVPAHFNGVGEIDRWGSKMELLLCPGFAVAIYTLISVLERFPSLWNTGVKITQENQGRIYYILKTMIVTMKFVSVLCLTFIAFYASLGRPLPAIFLPAVLVLVFGPTVYFMLLLYRNR